MHFLPKTAKIYPPWNFENPKCEISIKQARDAMVSRLSKIKQAKLNGPTMSERQKRPK